MITLTPTPKPHLQNTINLGIWVLSFHRVTTGGTFKPQHGHFLPLLPVALVAVSVTWWMSLAIWTIRLYRERFSGSWPQGFYPRLSSFAWSLQQTYAAKQCFHLKAKTQKRKGKNLLCALLSLKSLLRPLLLKVPLLPIAIGAGTKRWRVGFGSHSRSKGQQLPHRSAQNRTGI